MIESDAAPPGCQRSVEAAGPSAHGNDSATATVWKSRHFSNGLLQSLWSDSLVGVAYLYSADAVIVTGTSMTRNDFPVAIIEAKVANESAFWSGVGPG